MWGKGAWEGQNERNRPPNVFAPQKIKKYLGSTSRQSKIFDRYLVKKIFESTEKVRIILISKSYLIESLNKC
jgi:hypothetical protein